MCLPTLSKASIDLSEISVDHDVEILRFHLDGQAEVRTVASQVPQQIAAVAATEAALGLDVMFLNQMIDGRLAVVDLHRQGGDLEEMAKLVRIGVLHMDLVGQTAQEGLVDQVSGIQVGREDDHLIERNLNGLAGGERQISRIPSPGERSSD